MEIAQVFAITLIEQYFLKTTVEANLEIFAFGKGYLRKLCRNGAGDCFLTNFFFRYNREDAAAFIFIGKSFLS